MKLLFAPLRDCLRLVLKLPCPICQRPTDRPTCPDCERQLHHCQFPRSVQRQPALFAWGGYQGALKRAIAALKYDNHPELARPLGHWMGTAWLASHPSTSPIIVPIPMHPKKQRQRGFNQAELLAEAFCEQTGLTLATHGLERMRETTAQFTLASAQARTENVKDAFCLGRSFQRKAPTPPVWLLDDIYTTGATMESAAQTLRRQGIRVGGVIVLAQAGDSSSVMDQS